MPLTSSSSHVQTPIRFGRRLLRCAKTPTDGHSGLPRGRSGPNLVGVCGDVVEDVHDVEVRELVEALSESAVKRSPSRITRETT